MMEKSFGLFFFLKPTKNQQDGKRYVYLRITVNGVSNQLSTKRLWHPSRWSVQTCRATSNKEHARNLNAYLDVSRAKVYQAKKMLVEEDRELTSESLKNILQGKSDEVVLK
jgi:hypothetical protein